MKRFPAGPHLQNERRDHSHLPHSTPSEVKSDRIAIFCSEILPRIWKTEKFLNTEEIFAEILHQTN